MNISVLQENLAKAVSTVAKFTDPGRTLPVLGNILLEADNSRLRLAATNLQMSITMWIGAKVDRPGAITLPAKTFSDLVNNLSKERVDLSLDHATHTVTVRCGTTKSNIKGIDADEFPPINHGDRTDFSIEARVLREMINHTAFASAKEDTRPVLTGVYTLIEGSQVTMAATDGYRLSVRYAQLETPVSQKVEVVIPARTLMEVARIVGDEDELIGITLPGKRDIITFHMNNVDISSQVLEGRFPDYKAIIPRSYVTTMTVYTDDLLRKCKAAEIFSRDEANSGRLFVKPPRLPGDAGEVIVAGKSAERGDTDGVIDAHVEGEAQDISFNLRYLIEVLNVVDSERITFQSNGIDNPGVLRIEGRDDFVHVIMPMMPLNR
jgi:DNA polymerase-3 subunit beta